MSQILVPGESGRSAGCCPVLTPGERPVVTLVVLTDAGEALGVKLGSVAAVELGEALRAAGVEIVHREKTFLAEQEK